MGKYRTENKDMGKFHKLEKVGEHQNVLAKSRDTHPSNSHMSNMLTLSK